MSEAISAARPDPDQVLIDIADYAHRIISIRDGKIASDERIKSENIKGERIKEPSPLV